MTGRVIKRIAVVGAGTIGASWAAYFLARGLDVTATDPAPGAEGRLRDYVSRAWPALTALGLDTAASPERLTFAPELETAVDGADFVQESGPEREDAKRDTFRRLDAAAEPDVVLASSTSGYAPSVFQGVCAHPERVLVGHPFNPPHLIPLVEVVGGPQTNDEAIETAMRFYAGIGKHPIRIRRELKGHVANRLQAALWREAYHLVSTGAVTVAEVDAAIAHGPGLRWALMGPCLLQHLAGGHGGMTHALDHLGPLKEMLWDDLGDVRLTPDVKRALIDGVDEVLAGIYPEGMMTERDRLLVDLLIAKGRTENLP